MALGIYPADLIDGYPRLRRKLIVFFERRHAPGDELADETLLRVVQQFADGRSVENVDGFAFGVARHLYADWTRARTRPLPSSVTVTVPASTEARCLEKCLRRAHPDERELLEAYFVEKRERSALAAGLGVTLNALRQKVCKAKARLRSCIDACIHNDGA